MDKFNYPFKVVSPTGDVIVYVLRVNKHDNSELECWIQTPINPAWAFEDPSRTTMYTVSFISSLTKSDGWTVKSIDEEELVQIFLGVISR
jgi:hypothetical protein